MRMKRLLPLAAAAFCACAFPHLPVEEIDLDAVLNPEESFAESDAPAALSHDSLDFDSPWGYYLRANRKRRYPLLVSGAWGEGAGRYAAVERRYPAFVLDYQKNTENDGLSLAEWIGSAMDAGFRIDPNRVYLTGFSMGGSGSFPLAEGMYSGGRFFAAIIRVAGQSQDDLGEEIAAKTALWYHIGLEDDAVRVEVARSALAHFRAYACYEGAVESALTDDLTGYERTTIKRTRNGYPMFRYSEYVGMGHTSGPCYSDENLFYWLFGHSLEYR